MKSTKNILKEFKKFIKQEDLIQQDDKLLIGISGGIDSTILLYLIRKISAEYNLTILAVHINYHLRGKESDENEKFVRNFCHKLGIPLIIQHITIKEKSNLENQARRIRFRIFRGLLQKYDFNKIVLGHNKNDQAETLLLHLFRGSGISGLKGMLSHSRNIIRPILNFSRNELYEFAKQTNIKYSQDSSNFSLNFDRNKIRQTIIPIVETELNPKVIDKISESVHIFQQTDAFLQKYSKDVFPEIVTKQVNENYKIDLNIIKNKEILLFYVFRQVFGLLSGSEKGFFTVHFQEIINLIKKPGSMYIQLPRNIFVIKEPGFLKFSKKSPVSETSNLTRKIKRASRSICFENNYISTYEVKTLPLHGFHFTHKNICYIDQDKIKFPLTIRHYQPGDRFRPLGMKYNKKLKDFFIDSKIPRFERREKVIIEDQNQIIWIAKIRINDNVKITPKTQHVLRIKIIKKLRYYRKARRINK